MNKKDWVEWELKKKIESDGLTEANLDNPNESYKLCNPSQANEDEWYYNR